jgi:phospholipid/cholesterol/gamma-HCH transport system substrate-binding protein
MDRKVANNVVVGVFITLGVIAFVFLLFNIGGGSSLFSSQLNLIGRFSQVKGLHQGSEVSLSGLRIGVVKDIRIATDGSKDLIVELAISKKFAANLRKNSSATIKTQGVLGDKYVEVSIGSEDSPPLRNGDSINSGEQTDIFTKSGNLVTDVSRYFDKDGEVTVLLHNLNKLSANLAEMSSQLKNQKSTIHELVYGNSGTNINKSTASLQSILQKIDQGEGSLGLLINDPSVYEDLKAMMGGAKRSNILKYFMKQFIDSGDKEAAKEASKEQEKTKKK